MIHAIIIFNNYGKPRLTKFYQYYSAEQQNNIVSTIFQQVSKRDDQTCNFLELNGTSGFPKSDASKIIYRHYATLYFVFIVDESESELGILDLIQVFVESLDKIFPQVCELSLIFHSDQVLMLINEIVQSGLVLETNINNIVAKFEEQNRIAKAETTTSAVNTISSLKNLPHFKDLPNTLKDLKF